MKLDNSHDVTSGIEKALKILEQANAITVYAGRLHTSQHRYHVTNIA